MQQNLAKTEGFLTRQNEVRQPWLLLRNEPGMGIFAYTRRSGLSRLKVNFIDPWGLFDIEADVLSYLPASDAVGNFSAGLGDALLFDYGDDLRDLLGVDSQMIDRCSASYIAGDWASLALGTGRAAYAAAAKSLKLLKLMKNAEKAARIANSARNILKVSFSLGLSSGRIMPWAKAVSKYGDYATIIDKAAKTNSFVNTAGALAALGSIANECGCEQ